MTHLNSDDSYVHVLSTHHYTANHILSALPKMIEMLDEEDIPAVCHQH